MALGFAPLLRDARAVAINTFAGSLVYIRFYSASRPLTTGAAITSQILIVELQSTSVFAPAPSSGVLTLSPFFTGAIASAGTATWFRIVKSDGFTFVMDGSVSADITLTPTSTFSGGEPVEYAVMTITEGNA